MAEFAGYPSLKGMPVVISGGASGIGEAIVRNFAAQGSKVGFVDIAKEAGEALEAELTGQGATVKFAHCDLRDIERYQSAIRDFAAQHGDALALVNNAAHDERHKIEDVTPQFWDDRIAVNLRHAFFAAQAVVPGMRKAQKGSIINFGSISWMISTGNLAAYTASKAAAHGLSRSLARDLGPDGIRVNTVVPGWVMTQRQLDLWVDDTANALIDASQSLRGRVYPDDVARMVLFLAADDSQMISAQDFIVDGGWAHG
jgi:D-xylose 1-dehydrogenase